MGACVGFWTPEKLARLREIFPHYTTQECAEMLGSTVHAVDTKASRLRLRKSRAHIASVSGKNGRVVLTAEEKLARRMAIAESLSYLLEPPKPGRVRYVSKSGIGGMVK